MIYFVIVEDRMELSLCAFIDIKRVIKTGDNRYNNEIIHMIFVRKSHKTMKKPNQRFLSLNCLTSKLNTGYLKKLVLFFIKRQNKA